MKSMTGPQSVATVKLCSKKAVILKRRGWAASICYSALNKHASFVFGYKSGSITSAETVMLEKQSLDEFLSNINNGKTVIVSFSPQSRASIDVHHCLSPVQDGLKQRDG